MLTHIAGQPGHTSLHPLLASRPEIKNTLVVLISSDRGLAGAYNANIVRFVLQQFGDHPVPVQYVTVGRRGRDILLRRIRALQLREQDQHPGIGIRRGDTFGAEFSDLPPAPGFADVSAIGHLVVEEFRQGKVDEVYLVYTQFDSLIRQSPQIKQLLPLPVESGAGRVMEYSPAARGPNATYIYEPGETELLDQIVPHFTALQVYHAILQASASEHAARMVAMQTATDNAAELAGLLTLEYNKSRQQNITSEMLDIVGGAESLR